MSALVMAVAAVLAGGDQIERRAANVNGNAHYLVRLSPYHDEAARVRGVVLSFVNYEQGLADWMRDVAPLLVQAGLLQ